MQLRYCGIYLPRELRSLAGENSPHSAPSEVPRRGRHELRVTMWSRIHTLMSKMLRSPQQTRERLDPARGEGDRGGGGRAQPFLWVIKLDNVILRKPELLPDFTVHIHQNNHIIQTSSLFQTVYTCCLVISIPTM